MSKDYTYEEFVKAWLECETNAEIAERLGIHLISVSKTAKRLRDAGIDLPPRGRSSGKAKDLNVEALNNLIKEHQNGNPA